MTQRWNDLLFAHWAVPVDRLRTLVPASLTLDVYEGSGWASVTPFYLSHLRPRGLPALPWISEFPELNVRTYVTVGGKAGVYFFSLDAGNWLAVAGARATYHLPYFRAEMSTRRAPDGVIQYQSLRIHRSAPAAEFSGGYTPQGEVFHSVRGSLDYFLTERYCLYSIDAARRVYRAEIHHAPWPLQSAEADLRINTMTQAAGFDPARAPDRVSFASRLDVAVWFPQRL